MTDMINPAGPQLDELEGRLLEAIAGLAAGEGAVTRDATFADLEIDSLDLVELAQIVEDEFGIELAPGDVMGAETVGAAIDAVLARRS